MSRTPKRVLEAIEQGKIAAGYALAGREIYWRDRIWAALRKSLGTDADSALSEFDMRRDSPASVIAVAGEGNLWTPRQLLLVRNAQLLTPTKGLSELAEYFRRPSSVAVCVFELTDLDPESDDWRERDKAKGRIEEWDAICEVVLLSRSSLGECLEIIQREAAARGSRISRDAAEALATLLDRDLARIVNEIEKLSLQSGPSAGAPAGAEITAEKVRETVGQGAPAAQPLTEAIGSGRPARALDALACAIQHDAYLPLLISELTRYLRQLLVLKSGRARDGHSAARLLWAAKLPAPQSLLPELIRQSRSFSIGHLTRSLRGAAQADLALRSGPADARLVVEQFVLEIMQPLRAAAAGSEPRR